MLGENRAILIPTRTGLAIFPGGNSIPVRSDGRAPPAQGNSLHNLTHQEGVVLHGSGLSSSSCTGAQPGRGVRGQVGLTWDKSPLPQRSDHKQAH
ncbi:hypothetical protein GOODEAATRI_029629 [Goodea atripinnis]|uniref:Uncharacterized protein n=1 Tax=Goodea atripinnis TaxID=208336 RepID=A0ABV0Q227_9TELE